MAGKVQCGGSPMRSSLSIPLDGDLGLEVHGRTARVRALVPRSLLDRPTTVGSEGTVRVKGPGSGRESAVRALANSGIEVKTIEIGRPETDPQIIAGEIAEQLEKRSSFRRTMKQATEKAMGAGAKGIKLQLSGRLGGAEMARCEKGMEGSIPLSTLRVKVEYGFSEASTPQGNIGVKCWINNGDFLTGEINDATDAQAGQVSKKPARRRKG